MARYRWGLYLAPSAWAKEHYSDIPPRDPNASQEELDAYYAYVEAFAQGYASIPRYIAVPEYTFVFYQLHTNRYAKQFSEASSFCRLISDTRLWATTRSAYTAGTAVYDGDFVYAEKFSVPNDEYWIDSAGVEFLRNPDGIEKMVLDELDDEIIDCKIVLPNRFITILYLTGRKMEYGIKLHDSSGQKEQNLDNFAIYPMTEMVECYANYIYTNSKWSFDIKPTYDTEGAALIDAGIIQGTERGYDPLKPLTRLEAVTILVRALGLEDTPVADKSQFSDVAEGTWGVKYANIALEEGISLGVGDGKFSPNQLVSADQFSAMVLRAADEPEFDWQQVLELLIERGIITAEQADTMDLFTRGDMAKIIYEARENGLL